jgi:hypothetical protein
MRKSINCLFVALMMGALLVAGCTESEEPSPTPTPIPEMTLTLTPMVTLSPSPTYTPTPVVTPSPSITPTLVIIASPTPTTEVSVERSRLKLSVGQKLSYTLAKDGAMFGNSWYEVMNEDTNEGNTIYTIASGLEMTSSCATSPPTTSSATLRIDQYANPISYTSDATIGSG